MASRRHRFAVHRRALGYSQERLAEAIGVERTTVARWERGETDPQPWARPKIAEVLQISVEELDTILAHDRGGSRDATMVPGVLSIASVGRQHVAPELVCYFGAQLAGHYTADRYLGALHLLPVARAQHQVVEQLATVASGELRREFWMLATAYSALVGWLYQDAGDLKRSMHWHDVMLELAHRSGDVQHIGFALANKAMLRVDMGDGRGAVDLASAALAGQGRLCPKVRVLALQQAAHGLSLMGDRDGCDRLIDQAQLFLAKVDDAYPWGNACRALGYLDVQRATCHGRLGDPQSALEIWVEVLRDAGASSRRDLGVFRARQATALARSGESEEAVKIAAEVVPLVAETGSARMLRELINLRNVMIAERHELAGRNLEEMLSGAGLDSRRQWR